MPRSGWPGLPLCPEGGGPRPLTGSPARALPSSSSFTVRASFSASSFSFFSSSRECFSSALAPAPMAAPSTGQGVRTGLPGQAQRPAHPLAGPCEQWPGSRSGAGLWALSGIWVPGVPRSQSETRTGAPSSAPSNRASMAPIPQLLTLHPHPPAPAGDPERPALPGTGAGLQGPGQKGSRAGGLAGLAAGGEGEAGPAPARAQRWALHSVCELRLPWESAHSAGAGPRGRGRRGRGGRG